MLETAPSAQSFPPPKGCREATSPLGIEVLRLHYSADPAKGPEWAAIAKPHAPSVANWNQEQEIDFGAFLGTRLFPEFQRELTVITPFPVPHFYPRWMVIDPHPRRPHGLLWMAISPGDDHIYYRSYWPSKIYGKPGDTPEDDALYHIDDYVATIKLLESKQCDVFGPGGFADNGGKDEVISRRIMDPYGKAIASERKWGKEGVETFWDRYAELGIHCEPAKRDFQAGRDAVGRRLRPRKVIDETGERIQSQILIFDTLPELIYELENNRFPVLTPEQAARRDPTDIALPKRKHLTDCLAEGTPVRTARGDLPIEIVKPGDRVLTRQGWRRVADAWLVGERPIVSVGLSDGTVLRATSDHRVWVEGQGFKTCGDLMQCDTLVSWRESFSTERPTTTVRNLAEGVFTSQEPEGRGVPISTGIFGSPTTAPFHQGTTFITRTATRSIIRWRTWSARLRRLTFTTIWHLLHGPSVRGLGKVPPLGTARQPVASGIRRLVGQLGEFVRPLSWRVTSVARLSTPGQLTVAHAFALTPARLRTGSGPVWTLKQERALSAEPHSESADTHPRVPAHESVRVVSSPKPSGTAKVYDLTVEDAHEFFASGVLVHNCMRYIEITDPAFVEHVEPTLLPRLAEGVSY